MEQFQSCPIQLQSDCLFYGRNQQGASLLTVSGLPLGTSLTKVLEAHEFIFSKMLERIAELEQKVATLSI